MTRRSALTCRPPIATWATLPPFACASIAGLPSSRKSTIRAISTPAASRSAAACETAIVDRQDDGTLGGLDREPVDKAPRCVRQHDAHEVVTGEDERLLDDAACDDHAVRAELEQEIAVGDRHDSLLEEADRDRGCEQLDARLDGAAAELRGSADPVAVGEQRAADVVALVDHHDRLATLGGGDRCFEPSVAAADHGDVDVAILDIDALLARAVRIERAEPRGAAQDLLVERPELARPDEGLVVEARRRERARRACRSPASGRACNEPDVVLALDGGPLAQRRPCRRARSGSRRRSSGSWRSGPSSTRARAGGGT